MRRIFAVLVFGTLALAGCVSQASTVTPHPTSTLPQTIMNPEVLVTELNQRGISCTSGWREVDEGQGQRCANPKIWVHIDATGGELVDWMRESFEQEFSRDGGVIGRGNWLIGADGDSWSKVKDM